MSYSYKLKMPVQKFKKPEIKMAKKGFTLLELIVVIIIIGILATLGLTQYTTVVEKGRSAEAKAILGEVRTAQVAYKLDKSAYTTAVTDLYVSVPTSCASTHYFAYTFSSNVATATRCTGSSGKQPGGATASTITINYDTGAWGGTSGYY